MILEYTENGTQKTVGLQLQYLGTEDKNGHFHPDTTVAHLYNPDDDEDVVALGVAGLHHKDIFKRSTGRKIAFERAVENFTIGKNPVVAKEIRSTLWESFLQKCSIR